MIQVALGTSLRKLMCSDRLLWYLIDMTTRLLEKQLEPVSTGRENMVRVQVGGAAVIVLSQRFFDRMQPLLDYFAQTEVACEEGNEPWSDSKNARRAELVNKKYDSRLTATEKAELARLDQEAEVFLDHHVPIRNEVLELMLAGLKQKARTKKSKS